MCKNVVLESKVIKEDVEVEFSNEVLLASADESVRECNENLDGQRANFPQVYSETEVSQMFNEDRVSSSSYVGDMVSQNGPFIFCDDLGSAKTYSKFVWPFAWNEIVQGGSDRCYDCLLYTSRCV